MIPQELFDTYTIIAGLFLQTRSDRKKELAKLAVEAGIKERDSQIELARLSKRAFNVPPVGVYVYYHWKFLELVEEGKVTEDALQDLHEQQRKIISQISNFSSPI